MRIRRELLVILLFYEALEEMTHFLSIEDLEYSSKKVFMELSLLFLG